MFVVVSGVFVSRGVSAKSSYELFYPIVAGKVPGDSWYSLKMLREKFVALLLFDNDKKIDYHTSLSKKRLVEGEKLIVEKKNYALGIKSLENSVRESEKVWSLVKNGGPVEDTLVEANFMATLAEMTPGDEAKKITDLARRMKDLVK